MRALREAGLSAERLTDIRSGDVEMSHGKQALDLYIDRHGKEDLPTAILALGDSLAIGAIASLFQHGVRVPQDVSVVGFNNIDVSAYVSPPLTTVSQDPERLGQLAAKVVLDQLGTGEVESRVVPHATELVVRQSTGPVRSDTSDSD